MIGTVNRYIINEKGERLNINDISKEELNHYLQMMAQNLIDGYINIMDKKDN